MIGGRGKTICAALLLAAVLAAPAAASAKPAAPKAHSSVVGGRPADPALYGSTVALLFRNRLLCTGSVIAPTKVLTAAHCALGFDPAQLTVLANRPRIGDNTVGESLGVAGAALDPDFGASPLHDLAVLTLTGPTTAPPIALASVAEDGSGTPAGAQLGAAGFGQRNPFIFGHPRVGLLGEVTQQVRANCPRLLGPMFVPESMICALGERIGRFPVHRGVCFGDSGGPLISFTGSGPRLVGVASEVTGLFGCGLAAAPNVYVRTAPDLAFIREAAGLAPPVAPLVSFDGPGFVKAERQTPLSFVCSAACTVNVTMTPIALGRGLRPTLQTVQLPANQSGAASLPLGKRAVNALHTAPSIAIVSVRLEAFAAGKTETRTRFFGFHR